MSFQIISIGLLSFIVSLCVHLIVWRVFRIKKEIFILFLIFLIVPMIAMLVLCVLFESALLSLLAVALIHLALSVAYIQTYPALKQLPPTLEILLFISSFGNDGVSEDEIYKHLENDKTFFGDKVDELKNDALVRRTETGYALSRLGGILVKLFVGYRKLFGLGWGQG